MLWNRSIKAYGSRASFMNIDNVFYVSRLWHDMSTCGKLLIPSIHYTSCRCQFINLIWNKHQYNLCDLEYMQTCDQIRARPGTWTIIYLMRFPLGSSVIASLIFLQRNSWLHLCTELEKRTCVDACSHMILYKIFKWSRLVFSKVRVMIY